MKTLAMKTLAMKTLAMIAALLLLGLALAGPAPAQDAPPPNSPPAASAPATPAAPAPFDPALVSVTQAWGVAGAGASALLTWTVTLTNANPPSTVVAPLAVSTQPVVSYTGPDGAAQTVSPAPATVAVAGYTVSRAVRGGALAVTLPTLLLPQPGASDPYTLAAGDAQTYALAVPAGVVEGGASVTRKITFALAPAPVH